MPFKRRLHHQGFGQPPGSLQCCGTEGIQCVLPPGLPDNLQLTAVPMHENFLVHLFLESE